MSERLPNDGSIAQLQYRLRLECGGQFDRTTWPPATTMGEDRLSTDQMTTTYVVNRMTIPTGMVQSEFRSLFEDTVPRLPRDQVLELEARDAPWNEMVDLIEEAAPWGFLIYWTNDVDRLVRLAGDSSSAVAYLMGNHILMEKMFRFEPSVVMYAPLHVAIWSRSDGQAYFTIDKPSDQFGSFADPRVTDVGLDLDAKLAALLEHLHLRVPSTLQEAFLPRLRGH